MRNLDHQTHRDYPPGESTIPGQYEQRSCDIHLTKQSSDVRSQTHPIPRVDSADMPGSLSRLNKVNTDRTANRPQPRLKPRGLPPALEPHGVYAATNPADAALYGHDLLGAHRVHLTDGSVADFSATFHGVLIRDVTLGYLDYSTSVRVEVHQLADNHLVIVPATGLSSMTIDDRTVELSPITAAIPRPGKPVTLHCPAGVAHLVIRIERNAIDTHLSRLIGQTLQSPIDFEPVFDLSVGAATRWNFAVQMLLAELNEANSLLHQAAGLGSIEEFLMSALLYCQPSNYSAQLRSGNRPTGPAVQAAVLFIEQNLAADISIRDVAAAAEVSVRTLQNQFAADLHQTPTHFIRNRRLERARSDLADGSAAAGVSVTDIATKWGFNHLGRFAVTYRSRFGESPSQTLRS